MSGGKHGGERLAGERLAGERLAGVWFHTVWFPHLHGVVRVCRCMPEQRNDVAVVEVDQGAVVHGRRRAVLVRRRSWAGAGEAGDKGGEAASCSGFERATGAAGAARDLTRWRNSWRRRRGPTQPRGPGMHQNVLAGSGKLWQALTGAGWPWRAIGGSRPSQVDAT